MMKWIKQYPHLLNDVRMSRLSERAQLRYFQLYLLAGACDADGAFIEHEQKMTEAEIAYKLRIRDLRLFKTDLKALKDAGLLKVNGHGPYIADWKSDQPDWDKVRKDARERKQRERERHEHVTRDNPVTEKASHSIHAPRPKTKDQRPETKTPRLKTKTNPLPPSTNGTAAAGVAGGGAGDQAQVKGMDSLTDAQRAVAKRLAPIWRSASLGNKKLDTTLVIVATRSSNFDDARRASLAALASSYADKRANNKAVIAAHRVIEDTIPAEFYEPRAWTEHIPEHVLKAAEYEPVQEQDERAAARERIRKAKEARHDDSRASAQ